MTASVGTQNKRVDSLSDLEVRSEASGGSRLLFRSFEANSGSYLTKMIGKIDRFPAAAVEQPKSDRLLSQAQIRHVFIRAARLDAAMFLFILKKVIVL